MGRSFLFVFALVNIFIKISHNTPIIAIHNEMKYDNRKPNFRIKDQNSLGFLQNELKTLENLASSTDSKSNDCGRCISETKTTDKAMEKPSDVGDDARGRGSKEIRFSEVTSGRVMKSNRQERAAESVRTISEESDGGDERHPHSEEHSKDNATDDEKIHSESNKTAFFSKEKDTYNNCADYEHECPPSNVEFSSDLFLLSLISGMDTSHLAELNVKTPNPTERGMEPLSSTAFSIKPTNNIAEFGTRLDAVESGATDQNEDGPNHGPEHTDEILNARVGSGMPGFTPMKNDRISDSSYIDCPGKCEVRDMKGNCRPDLECMNAYFFD